MRRTLITAMLVLAALSTAGCTMSATDESAGGGDMPLPEAPGRPAEPGQPAPDQPTDDGADREVITTGYLTVVVTDPADAAEDAARLVEAAGGRVDGRTERAPSPGDPGDAVLTLRIPSARLTALLDDLRELGEAREVALNAEDVTQVTQDLDARIEALRASVDRLLGLLESAADTGELIEVESALAERQGELESLEAQRRYYSDQVSLATITLNLVSERDAEPERPDTFWTGVVTGWEAMLAFASGVLVVTGVLLPWLLVVAALGGLALLLIRRARRRRGVRSDTLTRESGADETGSSTSRPPR